MEERHIPWLELLETVLRRRRWILLGGLLGLVAGLIFTALRDPLFKATARIQLTAQAVSGPREAAMSDQQIQAELALLKTPALLRSVLEEKSASAEEGSESGPWPIKGWIQSVRQFGAELWASLHELEPPDPIDLQIRAIADRITVVPVGRSNLVEIAYVSENPEDSAEFVNLLLNHHVRRIAELADKASARQLYEVEKNEALERWKGARNSLVDFREEQGADFLAGDAGQLRNVLAGLQSQKVAAETEVLELRARSAFISNKLSEHPRTIDAEWTVTEDESVRILKQRILELEIERTETLSRFTPQSTIVQDLDRQIAEASRLLESKEGHTLSETTRTVDPSYQALEVDLVQTQAQLTSAEARVSALSEQIAIYRDRLSLAERTAGELERLEAEVTAGRELYRRYSEQEEQARVSTAFGELGFVNVSIVEEASAPAAPLPTKTRRTLVAATLFGLLLGLFSTFAADLLNPTLKGWRQAERLTNVPVIGMIPGK